MTKLPGKKARIYREQVKDRHTSHWDLDMLSREELEQLMLTAEDQADGDQPAPAKTRSD